MEKNKQYLNIFSIIIGLLIGISSLLGVIYYQNTKEINKYKLELNKKTKTKKELKKETSIEILRFYPASIAFIYDKQVYINIDSDSTLLNNLYGENAYTTLQKSKALYQDYKIKNINLSQYNINMKLLKLDIGNAKKVYSYEHGQTLSNDYGLIILHEDNKLSIISLYSLINGNTKPKLINELNDIKEIVIKEDVPYNTYALDKNNKYILLEKYIPKDFLTW